MAIDQEDQDKLDDIEISKEKEKQEQLQKIKEDADLWEERRNKLKDKSMEIAADPQAWLKGFLMKKAMEAGHYAISKKRRLEVAEAKEKESKINLKNNSDKLKTSKKLEDLEGKPLELNFGSEDSLNSIVNLLEGSNQIQSDQLRQDSDQWKADQRVSASEEASAGTVPEKSENLQPSSIGGEVKPSGGLGGLFKKPMDGIKGIMGNVLSKFGKAGKFLKGLGVKFLMPLITTPVGWAILAGLAVGGLVFAYWDDIVAFVGKMFDGVKSMFSKVVSKISGMFSAVGNAIKEIISFFNPMNLLPMIAKALLPPDMYGAVSSFFGGDNAEEIKSKDKKATLEKESAIGDKMEAELSSAKSDQLNLGKSLSSKNVIAASRGDEVITVRVGDKFEGTQLRNVSHAHWKLKQSGYKVLSPEETNAIMDENEKDIKLKQFDLDVQVGREVKLLDDIDTLDESIATGKAKNDKPGNVVADLVRAGTAEHNYVGNSTIKDWPALQKLDYETLEKVLAFDDWGDKTKRGILGIMDEKKQLIGANDLEPIKPNEVSVLRKDEMMSGALQKGMDNNISQGSGNNTPAPSQNIISAPVTNNNNTTIKKERTHDTDITSMSLNKSATMFPEEEF
jgi:hypothetical protein